MLHREPHQEPTLRLAIVGAGPVGLALALLVARTLPQVELSVFDARPADRDVSGDPRTLALALGSVQLLQRLRAWDEAAAQPIREVHVSQAPPNFTSFAPAGFARLAPEVQLRAADEGVAAFGAVIGYGALVAPLQRAWLAEAAAQPQRLHARFGTPVAQITTQGGQAQLSLGTRSDAKADGDAEPVESFDLVVVAEGGVFHRATQLNAAAGASAPVATPNTHTTPATAPPTATPAQRRGIVHDYRQTAWVGQVELEGGRSGLAVERFTRHGPLALLPLPTAAVPATIGATASGPLASSPPSRRRAALVWCVPADDDPVAALDDVQRIAVLNTLLPGAAGRLVGIGALKAFALGLLAERTLVDGRQLRIGNAAQTLHPVAGQGLNLGLRDAYAIADALGEELAAAGLRGHAPRLDAALRRIEWQRAPDRWSMIATTDFLARSFTWQWPGLGFARGAALALLDRAGPLKSALARQMMFGRR